MKISELLFDLVAVRSDTGTFHEVRMAEHIFRRIAEDPYFAGHPQYCGLWDGGDHLDRPVVWALKRGTGRRTLIISGHYDTVSASCYGVLETVSRSPLEMRPRFRQLRHADPVLAADLDNEFWLFGRGTADMKAGLAVGMNALFEHEPGTLNVLFTAVSDEENLSAGARQAVGLYEALQVQFDLDYELCVIAEPNDRNPDKGDPVPILMGGSGKILPVVVAKGTPAHGSKMLDGINSAHLVARIAEQTEYDLSYVSVDKGCMTQPPAIQLLRDLKEGYDVSMPEYAAAAFNLTFFMGTDASAYLDKLKAAAQEAIVYVKERRQAAILGLTGWEEFHEDPPEFPGGSVLTLAELRKTLIDRPGFAEFHEKAEFRLDECVAAGETLLTACIRYVRDLLAFSAIDAPAVVVAAAPPYYPAMNCDYLDRDIHPILDRLIGNLECKGIKARKVSYSFAMTDMSYTSCADPGAAGSIMANMSAPPSQYELDVDAMARLNIPTIMIGPAQRDIHQIGERVYLPDINETLPAIFRELMIICDSSE